VLQAIVSGLLIVLPVYLAGLLVAKILAALVDLMRPLAGLFPDWLPGAGNLLALLLGLTICFLIGASLRTPTGRAARERMETSVFEKIPGYSLFRGLTRQIAGVSHENVWKPALSEIEDALVPSFIIEDLPDGSFTVFVPSVNAAPRGTTPSRGLAGASRGSTASCSRSPSGNAGVRLRPIRWSR